MHDKTKINKGSDKNIQCGILHKTNEKLRLDNYKLLG